MERNDRSLPEEIETSVMFISLVLGLTFRIFMMKTKASILIMAAWNAMDDRGCITLNNYRNDEEPLDGRLG